MYLPEKLTISYVLGTDASVDALAMTQVPLPPNLNITYITVTYQNAMMIGGDGQLYGFGRNDGEYLNTKLTYRQGTRCWR